MLPSVPDGQVLALLENGDVDGGEELGASESYFIFCIAEWGSPGPSPAANYIPFLNFSETCLTTYTRLTSNW